MIATIPMLIRYTEVEMARRLLAFAFAFIVTGAPLASDVCEVFCAEHAGRSIDQAAPASHDHFSADASEVLHHHHSDAPPTPATGSTAVRPVSHECVQV